MKLNWTNPNSPADGLMWNFCPIGGKRHGILILTRNEAGGLMSHCPKCYTPRKKRGERKG